MLINSCQTCGCLLIAWMRLGSLLRFMMLENIRGLRPTPAALPKQTEMQKPEPKTACCMRDDPNLCCPMTFVAPTFGQRVAMTCDPRMKARLWPSSRPSV